MLRGERVLSQVRVSELNTNGRMAISSSPGLMCRYHTAIIGRHKPKMAAHQKRPRRALLQTSLPPKTPSMQRDDQLTATIERCAKAVAAFINSSVGPESKWKTKAELAQACGIGERTLYRLASSSNDAGFSIESVARLASTTGSTIAEIMGIETEPLPVGKAIIDLDIEKMVKEATPETIDEIASGKPLVGLVISSSCEVVDISEFNARARAWLQRVIFLARNQEPR